MKGFKIFIITSLSITAILFMIYFGVYMSYRSTVTTPERENIACDTEDRIFDYANELSSIEKTRLEETISKYEQKLGFDIVLVLLDEDIGNGTANYSYDNYDIIEKWTQDFYVEHNFGWDNEDKDGVIFVANYYDGYAWMELWGDPYYKCSATKRDNLIDDIKVNLRVNPYKASNTYIKGVYKNMTGLGFIGATLPWYIKFMIGFVAAAIFLLCNLKVKAGKVTVNKDTYIESGNAKIKKDENVFLSKHTTSRRIESSSSGSGGGGGGGGGSHGGGGGRF